MTPRPRGKSFYVVLSLAILVVVGSCFGVGVITWGNYRRFPVRAKQAECKSNLKAWYAAQRTHHLRHERYEPEFAKVGFAPESGNRYAYFAGTSQVIGVDTGRNSSPAVSVKELPASVLSLLGLKGECPRCDITAACMGNIDADATLDVWVISTGPLALRGADEEGGAPGEPVLLVDDSRE